jgi:hypothetical protein
MTVCEMAPPRENRSSQMKCFAQKRNTKYQGSDITTGNTVSVMLTFAADLLLTFMLVLALISVCGHCLPGCIHLSSPGK